MAVTFMSLVSQNVGIFLNWIGNFSILLRQNFVRILKRKLTFDVVQRVHGNDRHFAVLLYVNFGQQSPPDAIKARLGREEEVSSFVKFLFLRRVDQKGACHFWGVKFLHPVVGLRHKQI